MNNKELAALLFPHIHKSADSICFPPRYLPNGAMVTRFAPSPTGFMHIGNLYGAIINERLAHSTNGVFYLRIEDTDQKREVLNGTKLIIDTLSDYNIAFDEGAINNCGLYGPYYQRQRAEIYQTFAKDLVERGLAYPCFCTEDELTDIRTRQEAIQANYGYYGKWAKHRNISLETAAEALNKGNQFVLRFRSPGSAENTVHFTDMVRGEMTFPENELDLVLLKSDGIPTYHFAHVVDDHLMGTTHVVRGEEWLATLPFHLQLFEAMGWEPPHYIHTASVMKNDGGSKRKLSKRKDPEAALSYYISEGYPALSVIEYLMTLLNSNYEEWRLENPTLPYTQFPFTIEKLSASGALFDLNKLRDVSKNVVASMTASQVCGLIITWAQFFEPELAALLSRDISYSTKIFAIGRSNDKPRKDLFQWSQAKEYVSFFFDELFSITDRLPEKITIENAAEILRRYSSVYNSEDDVALWFDKLKKFAGELGFAPETKLYKKNPSAYKGSVGDVSMVIRLAVTGRQNAPDLHQVLQILGKERVCVRLNAAIELFSKQDII